MPLLNIFEVSYTVCQSTLNYFGPSPIDTVVFSPNCNGKILSGKFHGEHKLRVFPNASTGIYTIADLGSTPIEFIKIYDRLGREISAQGRIFIFEDEVRLDLDNLTLGIYIVHVRIVNTELTKRLVLVGS